MKRLAIPALLILVAGIHLASGSSGLLSLTQVLGELARGPGHEGAANTIVWDIRLPRLLVASLSGVSLATVGAAFQALFRNPLADPYVVGVSSGAAVGAALAVSLGYGAALYGLGTVGAGLVTGLASLALVRALAQKRGLVEMGTLLLAGVTVSALLSALLSLILLLAGQDSGRILAFLLGHTSDANWPRVFALLPFALIGSFWLARQGKRLNALAMGETTARRLGVETETLARWLLLVGTAMTAATVGAVGIIGFVGLVGPHVARRLVGVDWRKSLPTAGGVGALIMVASDLIGQRLLPALTGTAGMEVNVGIVAALLGAPSLLILLKIERVQ
ncbi:iron ABC transporter permease [soil metagenome]